MSRKCKICESKLRNEIDKLLVSNDYTAEYIAKYACDSGLVVSQSTVRRHGTYHVIGYNPSTNEIKKLDKKPPSILLIDFDNYLLSLGIDRNKVENIDEFFDENVTAYQKGINILMFKTMTVINDKLDSLMNSQGKFPSDEIKTLKSMSDIFYRSMAIDKAIDENVALNHLESLGYDIKQSIVNITPNKE